MGNSKPEDFDKIKLLEIKITNDISYFNDYYGISKSLGEKIRETTQWSQSATKKDIKRIKKLVKKYPNIPHFMNHLSVAYSRNENFGKAYELNRKIREEHPQYCYAFLNECNILLYQEMFDELEEFLEPDMDIGAHFPDREYFHPDEVCSFYSVCARFKFAVGDLETGDEFLKIVKQIDPDSKHIRQIETEKMRAMMFATSDN